MTPTKTSGTVTNEQLTDDTLTFDTTAIGVPHWIKISYFPNWHVKGAEGPYLVSPSFMMVIPTQSHVTLYYGRTNANNRGPDPGSDRLARARGHRQLARGRMAKEAEE